MNKETEKIKCLIIGSGPAGYTAAIYAARANLRPVVYKGLEPGGQLTSTTEIDNFPGYPNGVTGFEIMKDFEKQAQRFNTDIRDGSVTSVNFLVRPFEITVNNEKNIFADTVIIATGASARWLGLKSEQEYKGAGVSACATCDGFFYKGKDVAVIGGGDTAAEDATYLAKLCNKVYLIHRRDKLRASISMQNKIFNTPNIEVLWDYIPKEILGKKEGFIKSVNSVLLTNVKTGKEKKINIDGFFVAVGHKPNSDIFKNKIDLDEKGYIITAPDSTKTNIKGIFAAGDIQDPVFRQAVTSAGSGCMAAIEAEKYLSSIK
jgi:thioredoxin reductase (NADPH)